MVITEMDKGKEKLLAVARTYLYSVDIQIVDSAKHLRDKLGYLGKFSLFECYSLFVLKIPCITRSPIIMSTGHSCRAGIIKQILDRIPP